MTAMALKIQALLQQAHQHDLLARRHRQAAGHLLAQLREVEPTRWHRLAGVDQRSGELYIAMATGSEVTR